MFSRITRIASMPLHVVNGVSLRRDGRIAPKVEQAPFNGLSIAPAASNIWNDSGSAVADPFLWTPSPRQDFKDLTGLDFGYRPSSADEVPWYEKTMDLSGFEFDERPPVSEELPLYDQPSTDWFMHEDSKPSNAIADFGQSVTGEFEKLDSMDFDNLFEDFENNPYADVQFEYEHVTFDSNGTVVQKVPEECLEEDAKTECDESTVVVPGRVRTNLPLAGFPVSKKARRSHSRSQKLEITSPSDDLFKPITNHNPRPSASGRPQRSCRRLSCLELTIHSINLSDELFPGNDYLLQSEDHHSRPRGITRKPCVDPEVAVRRARNNVSARKYRDRKRLEKLSIKRERELLEVRNADLHMQVQLLQRNIEDMKKLLNI